MFVTVIAVLCSLTHPGCVEEIVTDSNMDENITFQECMVHGQLGVADWIGKHPLYHAGWRVDRVKCAPGHYEIRGRV